MTTNSAVERAAEQANRLEVAASAIAALVRQPANAHHLRPKPGSNEWNVMETVGHCAEMIPYWIEQIHLMIAATGTELPRIGRALDSDIRLAGPASGDTSEPEALATRLEYEAYKAAAAIRAFTEAERARRGVNARGEEQSVEDIIQRNLAEHSEMHLKQVEAALDASG